MPTTTRLQCNMAATKEDVRNIIEDALKPVQEQIAELPEKDWINDTVNEAINKLEEKFDQRCQEYDQKIENLERRVDELEGLVKVIERLEARIDDGEQYSRRMCLRINGVPIPSGNDKEDCVEKVHELIKETGVDVPKDSIDRAHRIGRVSDEGKQQIIVRFKSFRERTLVYRSRKNCKKAAMFLDLTKRRLELLFWAKEVIKNKPDIEFAFADINCNIGAKMKSGNFLFFSNEQEFYEKATKAT